MIKNHHYLNRDLVCPRCVERGYAPGKYDFTQHATRKLPNGHHQQIQCHVTLLQSDTAMKPLTTKLRKKAQEMAAQVIEEPMTFATENPTNVYRDGILYRTLITFDVQGTTHNNLYSFRNWLVQCLGGHERHRINFHVSVDYVFEVDCID